MKTSNAEFNVFNDSLYGQPKKLPVGSVLKKILQVFIQLFANGDELKIWITTDRYGNKSWHAYDLVSDRSTIQSSEAELRTWIEQRYYN